MSSHFSQNAKLLKAKEDIETEMKAHQLKVIKLNNRIVTNGVMTWTPYDWLNY